MPLKRCFTGGRWWPTFSGIWILSSSPPKKNIGRIGPPLTKLSRSVHAGFFPETTFQIKQKYLIFMENFQKNQRKSINTCNKVKLTNQTPFINLNPLSRNPGSATEGTDQHAHLYCLISSTIIHLLTATWSLLLSWSHDFSFTWLR